MKYPVCRKGHLKTPDNVYSRTDRDGYTLYDCRTCRRDREANRVRVSPKHKREILRVVSMDRVKRENLKREYMTRELSAELARPL